MAEVIKRVKILKKDLPFRNSTTNSYNIRYRIVEEEGNKSSHWSPIYNIYIPKENIVDAVLSFDPSTKVFNLVWQPDESDISFDVYISYDNKQTWQYINTAYSPYYSGIVKPTATNFAVWVQKTTYPKLESERARLYVSGIQTL
jgi:hypothetical protein